MVRRKMTSQDNKDCKETAVWEDASHAVFYTPLLYIKEKNIEYAPAPLSNPDEYCIMPVGRMSFFIVQFIPGH